MRDDSHLLLPVLTRDAMIRVIFFKCFFAVSRECVSCLLGIAVMVTYCTKRIVVPNDGF